MDVTTPNIPRLHLARGRRLDGRHPAEHDRRTAKIASPAEKSLRFAPPSADITSVRSASSSSSSTDSGFTLIELLIVIVILGVLATVVVLAVAGVVDRGERNTDDADRRSLVIAQESYFAHQGVYASEADLVSFGLIREESKLHDIALNGDGSYTLIVVPGP